MSILVSWKRSWGQRPAR
uniref:Uncharacterized protein n=1 Tax=Arundo donax TaxID=35708 RepID=A0A0A9E9H9_ARUDO